MRKLCWSLLSVGLSIFSFGQKNTIDSLAGFDFVGAQEHASHMKTAVEKYKFMEHAKRTYVYSKFHAQQNALVVNADGSVSKGIGNNTILQGPQPAGCNNIDFESGNTSGWTVTGDNQIQTTAMGNDPFGGFPKVKPGGNFSLRLNDNNISGKVNFTASATRVIPVTAINNQFQLHFAFCILNFPHPGNAAAIFKIQFLNAANQPLSCPSFSCYYANPPGAFVGMPPGTTQTSPLNGVNIGNQSYPVTYVPWQTIAMDLSPYNGQNITVRIDCNWCIYNYDWGYCYIDADCMSATPSATVCPGQLCGPAGMQSYTWTPPAGPVVTNSCISAMAPGTYTCDYTPFAACAATVKTATYLVTPPPASGFTSANACTSYTFTNTGAAAPAVQTFSFVGPGAPASYTTTNATSTVVFPSSATYTVYQNVAIGTCNSTTSMVVTPPPPPDPAFTTPTYTQCLNGNSFTFNAIQATGTHTYDFNPVVGAPANGNTNNYGPVSFTAPGTYTVGHTITNTGCTASTTSVITINPHPVAVAANNGPICTGSNLTFTGNGGGTYSWSGPGGFTSAVQNPTITSATPAASGVYNLTVTVAGCTGTTSTNATVTTPTASASNTGPYCAGASIQLNAGAGTAYSWTGPGGYTSNLQNPTIAGSTAAMSGTYDVTITIGNCFATASTSVTVNALPLPNPTNTGAYCAGDAILLNVGAYNTYTWSGPGGYTSSQQNPTISNSAVSNSGAYTVIVADANGCVNSAVTNVVVNPLPVVSVNNPVICENGNTTLSANGGATYAWSGPGGFTSSSQNASVLNASLSNAGQYTVVVTSAAGCVSTGFSNLTVNPLPTPVAMINSPICINNILNLSATGGVNYQWTGPNGFFASVSNPTIQANSTNYTGTYNVVVTDANGCTAATSANATVNPLPVPSIVSGPNTGCAPICVQYTVNAAAGIANAAWNLGNGSSANGINFAETCYNIPGIYTITAVVTDQNGCSAEATYTTEVYPNPVADFNHAPIKPIINIDGDVVFTDASHSANIVSWNWFFMNTAQYTSNLQNPTFLYTEAGTYAVALVVKSDHGCTDTIVRPLVVGEDFGIYVPNAFTPNADGLNDVFQPKGFGIVEYQLQIFDRWGERIFTTKKFEEAWDGRYQGRGDKSVEQGTYTWLINVKDVFGKAHEYKGHVTLIR